MPAAFFWISWISKALKALRIPRLWHQRLVTVLHIVTYHQNRPRTKEKTFFSFSTETCLSHWNTPQVQHLMKQPPAVLGSGPGKPCGLLKWCGWVTIPLSPLPTNLQMLRLFNCSAHTSNHRFSCATAGQIRSWDRVFFLLGFYGVEHIWARTVAFKEVRNIWLLPHQGPSPEKFTPASGHGSIAGHGVSQHALVVSSLSRFV